MVSKYGIIFLEETIAADKKRLINQLWKVLPMKENNEDWEKQLRSVIHEIMGLEEVFNSQLNLLILLCKLESLVVIQEFVDFRKTVFESISLLDESLK